MFKEVQVVWEAGCRKQPDRNSLGLNIAAETAAPTDSPLLQKSAGKFTQRIYSSAGA